MSQPMTRPPQGRALLTGLFFAAGLGALIVIGSRRLAHFDAALVSYTFATLFATFGVTYRYAMWLQRPPTRMYWRRGWQVFARPGLFVANLVEVARRLAREVAANRFIFRRGLSRGAAHLCIVDPSPGLLSERSGLLADVLASHPPITQRIDRLRAMAYVGPTSGAAEGVAS